MSRLPLLSALLLAAGSAVAQPGAQPAAHPAARAAGTLTPVTTVEGITEYRMPNGLRVVLFPDVSKPTVTVNITYFVGSAREGYGETGMAHLLEHMVFKGSTRHRNIPSELTSHGAFPNGTTWLDRTNYFETMPANDTTVAWALDLEADRMVNSFIAKKDLESEFTVVRNEFEAGENSPQRILLERAMSTAYLWHGYGRSTIGNRSDIENVPIERLQAFYRKYYQPDNAMLVVAGRFDDAKVKRQISEKFGRIPRPARALERSWTAEPTQDGERAVTLRRVGDQQVVGVVYHMPAGSHPDFAAVDVLTEVLSTAPAGRLYKSLVETKKAASVFAARYQMRDPGVLFAFAQVRKDDSAAVAQRALLAAFDDVVATPPTAAEVDRARTTLLKNWDLSFNSSQGVALDLSEWAAIGDWRMMFIHRDRLQQVKPADVQRVAAAYVKPSNRTVAMFVPTASPDRAEIPPTPDVESMVAGYKGNQALAAGEAFDPSPSNVATRTTWTTLPSGLQVALLPKRTRGGVVTAQIILRLGDEKSLMGRSMAAQLAGSMLSRGTATLTRQQFKDSLDKLKAQGGVSGNATQASGAINTTRENLAPALRLIAEALRAPAMDAKEFELLKAQMLSQLEAQRSDPGSLAFNLYQRAARPRPKGHPQYTATFDELAADIAATTLDDVKRFHAEFYGASAAQVAVVGDFDDKQIALLAKELFGAWASPTKFTRIATTYADAMPLDSSINTPDKANAVFVAGLNLKMRDGDPSYPALVLADYIVGGGFLNSRLATRIRQKDGLSYGVGSGFTANPIDTLGSWQANAIYAPENVDRLERAFREELTRAIRDGFTAEEVAQAKAGWLQGQQVMRAQDGSLAGSLVSHLYFKRPMSWDAALESKVGALTAAEVSAAFRQAIDPSKLIVIKAGDWSKKPKAMQ